jgi:3-oxoacyl-[acyl-carrier protein] reductase
MNNSYAVKDKVALVTGASRGIGFAIARKLVGMGAKLSICARHNEPLERAANELRKQGPAVLATPADVTRRNDLDSVVKRTEQSFGPIELLVNNAGIGYFSAIEDASEAQWDSVLDTNLKAVFLLSTMVVPGMIRRRAGQIINIASLAGKSAFAGGSIYCASKWGLLGLTQCMAEDLRAYGIRVSAVCPGTVATEFSPHGGKDVAKMLQPEDVAHAVEALLTQSSRSFISEVLLRPTQKP